MDVLNLRHIEICLKQRIYDDKDFYGIVLMEGEMPIYRPIYPHTYSRQGLKALEEFLTIYREELLEFYKNGVNFSFANFIGKENKDAFRDYWFSKGVLIH